MAKSNIFFICGFLRKWVFFYLNIRNGTVKLTRDQQVNGTTSGGQTKNNMTILISCVPLTQRHSGNTVNTL